MKKSLIAKTSEFIPPGAPEIEPSAAQAVADEARGRQHPKPWPEHRMPLPVLAFSLAIVLALLEPSTGLAASNEDVGSFRVTLHRRQHFSGLEGYVQVPMGGQPGTATRGRPTFDEIDFSSLLIQSAGLTARRHNHTFSIIGDFASRIDSSTLATSFLSRKEEYFAGDPVRTEFKTHLFFMNHKYHLPIGKRFGVPVDISFGPSLVLWDFKFRIVGPNGKLGIGGREFTQSNIHFISAARAQFGNLSFYFESLLPLPVNFHNFAAISFEAGSEYVLWKKNLFILDLFVTIAYTRIRFEDNQPMPNDVLIDLAPVLNAGFRIRL